jgi:hypothetical protein
MKNIKTSKTVIFYRIFFAVVSLFAVQSDGFGQYATFDVADNVIDFEVNGVGRDRIESVTLINSATGALTSTSYTEQFRAAGSGGGLVGAFFQITASDIPAGFDFENNPVALLVILKPATGKTNKTIISIPVKPIGVEVATMPIPRAEADGKDDAEVYVSGKLITQVGEGPQMSADIKIEREFAAEGLPFLYAPFFKLKTSNNSDEDSDKLELGVKFTNSFFFANSKEDDGSESVGRDKGLNNILARAETQGDVRVPRFTQLKKRREQREYFELINSVLLESDRHFKVTNFIVAPELKWNVRPKIFRNEADNSPVGKLTFTPSFGADLGRNLHSKVVRTDKAIARLKGSLNLTLSIPRPFGNLIFQSLKWENDFTQRWFLANEQAYDRDGDGNLILVGFGKGPRSHFTSNLQFKLNDYFGPSLTYEWGQIPPLYEKVNHRLTLGFTYSFKRNPFR